MEFSPGKGVVVMLMEPTSLNRGEGLFIGSQCVAEQKKEGTLLTWALLFSCR